MKKEYYSFIKLMACCSLALLIAGSLNAQDIIHPTSGSTSVTVFSGTPLSYSDSGGSSGNYSNSESGSVSFCPDSPGEMVTISFSSVDIETRGSSPGCWDFLTITDANGTLVNGCGEQSGSGDVAGPGADDITPGSSFTSMAANGCLTVDFTSDSSINKPGWEATVSTDGDGGGGTCDDNEVVVDMSDSFGDGWNGNVLEIRDENDIVVASATIDNGSSGSETFCLPDGCYSVDVDGGSFDSEVSWDIYVNGDLELSGGAPEADLELNVNGDCGGECELNEYSLELDLDFFASETAWEILDENGGVAASGSGYVNGQPDVIEPLCLPDGCYELFIYDSFGDGIFSSSPDFTLSDGDDNVIASGEVMDFGGSVATFDVGDGCAVEGALPEPWMGSGIGSDCNDFGYDEETTEFSTIGCANNAFPGTTMDNVAFVHQTICGDGEIVAKIESVSPGGYGGLMMRDDLSPGAKQVSVFSNLSNSLRWESRAMTNGSKTVQNFVKPYPIWLKLVRQGDWVFGYYSANGMSFQYVHASYVPMGTCVEVGLAGFSFIPGQDATATYSNVSVVGSGYGVPTAETPGLEVISSARQAARLFPNPAREMITIEFEAHATQPTYLNLRNSVGQLMEQRQLEPQSFRTEWGIESLPNGMYTVEVVREGSKTQVLRFVKSN